MKKFFVLVLSLLSFQFAVAAGNTLDKDTSDYGAALSRVISTVNINDRVVGNIRVASLDTGPFANPIQVAVFIESEEPMGDHMNYDVYVLNEYFAEVVSAEMSGDELIIFGDRNIVGDSGEDFKIVPGIVRLKVKENGKALPNPIIQRD